MSSLDAGRGIKLANNAAAIAVEAIAIVTLLGRLVHSVTTAWAELAGCRAPAIVGVVVHEPMVAVFPKQAMHNAVSAEPR